jgi:cyclophilin family peptidyl-prolyl cis-trans isomerase
VGDMVFMLFKDVAPRTVDVFSGLSCAGFYNSNTIFHRVIAGFMNQGGDPLTNGTGGPVFRYDVRRTALVTLATRSWASLCADSTCFRISTILRWTPTAGHSKT